MLQSPAVVCSVKPWWIASVHRVGIQRSIISSMIGSGELRRMWPWIGGLGSAAAFAGRLGQDASATLAGLFAARGLMVIAMGSR